MPSGENSVETWRRRGHPEKERPSFLMQLELGLKGLVCESDGGISFYSHSLECIEELPALAKEEPIRGEACDRSDGSCKFIGQRTNDRDMGEVGVDEFTRNRED